MVTHPDVGNLRASFRPCRAAEADKYLIIYRKLKLELGLRGDTLRLMVCFLRS